MNRDKFSVDIKDLDLRFGDIEVLKDLNLSIHDGEFLVLLGSSGCGKSTLLNCIAGLLEVSAGQIFINDKNVTWHEPSERGIGMVFQSYALYPQMSVKSNLSFGLKNAKVPKDEIEERVAKAADILQLQPLLDRKPSALSGGQRQRVAIGRALVRDVDVFLFDEPLSNLDAKLRAELRVEIKRLHQNLKNTMIYVTHDQIEAMTLADRIAIMRYGKIMQLSSPDEIYNMPQNIYVADFIGSPSMNFYEGVLDGTDFTHKGEKLSVEGYKFSTNDKPNCEAVLGVRPEHFLTGAQAKKATITTKASVNLVEPMGSDTLVYADVYGQNTRIRVHGYSRIKVGETIDIGIEPKRSSMFYKESELRI